MRYRYQYLFIGFFSSFLSEVSVSASEIPVIYGNENLERIAADLHRLEKYVYRTIGADHLNKPKDQTSSVPSALSDSVSTNQPQVDLFQSKFETLSQEIPALVGRIEELEHKNQKLLDNNKTFVDYITHFKQEMETLKQRNKELEEKITQLSHSPKEMVATPSSEGVQPEEIPSLPPLAVQSEPVVDPTPTLSEPVVLSIGDLEKKAKAALVAARYDDARQLFEELLKRDLSIEQEVATRFYLGEIWLLKKQHGKASEQYLKAYQKDPKGAKAPKNLLKLATSLYALGKKKEACVSLQKLLKEYPKAESTVLSMASEKRVEYCSA